MAAGATAGGRDVTPGQGTGWGEAYLGPTSAAVSADPRVHAAAHRAGRCLRPAEPPPWAAQARCARTPSEGGPAPRARQQGAGPPTRSAHARCAQPGRGAPRSLPRTRTPEPGMPVPPGPGPCPALLPLSGPGGLFRAEPSVVEYRVAELSGTTGCWRCGVTTLKLPPSHRHRLLSGGFHFRSVVVVS